MGLGKSGLVFGQPKGRPTDQFRIPKASRRLYPFGHYHSATTAARILGRISVIWGLGRSTVPDENTRTKRDSRLGCLCALV